MSTTALKEACACGATFDMSGYDAYVRQAVKDWRSDHRHVESGSSRPTSSPHDPVWLAEALIRAKRLAEDPAMVSEAETLRSVADWLDITDPKVGATGTQAQDFLRALADDLEAESTTLVAAVERRSPGAASTALAGLAELIDNRGVVEAVRDEHLSQAQVEAMSAVYAAWVEEQR